MRWSTPPSTQVFLLLFLVYWKSSWTPRVRFYSPFLALLAHLREGGDDMFPCPLVQGVELLGPDQGGGQAGGGHPHQPAGQPDGGCFLAIFYPRKGSIISDLYYLYSCGAIVQLYLRGTLYIQDILNTTNTTDAHIKVQLYYCFQMQ